MPNNFNWPIDRTLSGATTPGQSGPWNDGNVEYSAFPIATALLEPYHQMQFPVISMSLVACGVLTFLPRCSRCILKPTGPHKTLNVNVLWTLLLNLSASYRWNAFKINQPVNHSVCIGGTDNIIKFNIWLETALFHQMYFNDITDIPLQGDVKIWPEKNQMFIREILEMNRTQISTIY